jgi:hypothetical protein
MRKFVLLLLVVSVGCNSVGKPGVAIVTSPPDAAAIPHTVAVPQDGKYELRREGGTAHEIPMATVEMKSEERIGFIRNPDGSVAAQAGPAEIPIPDGTYYWTMAKESEMTGPRLRWYYAKQAGKGVLIVAGVLVISTVAFFGSVLIWLLVSKTNPIVR